MKFRKKPIVIEATQWFEGTADRDATLSDKIVKHGYIDFERVGFYVVTIHGDKAPVVDGDWIITEPDGEHFYPCKPDIFANSYEPLDDLPTLTFSGKEVAELIYLLDDADYFLTHESKRTREIWQQIVDKAAEWRQSF